MGILCGFIGPPNAKRLKRMAASLNQAHMQPIRMDSLGDHVHISSASDPLSTQLCGVAKTPTSILAMEGMPSHPTFGSTEQLLQAVESQGISVLFDLEGPFVALLHTDDQTYLFRDRAGRRTVYHLEVQGAWHFATRTCALYNLPEYSPAVMPSSIARYLSFSFVPGEDTLLEGIKELLPGSHFKVGDSEAQRYHFAEKLPPLACQSDQEWIDLFNLRLEQSIQRCSSDWMKKYAVFLSGGIDSSLITAALAELHGGDAVHTYSLHFGPKYSNELSFVNEVVQQCGVHNEVVEVNPKKFLPDLHEIVAHLNDPIGDPVTMPNHQLAKHVAAQRFEGVFNGEGGDPLFGGPKNAAMLMHHWYGIPHETNHREKAYLGSYRRGYEELKYLLSPDLLAQIDEQQDLEAVLTPFFNQPSPETFLHKLLMINTRLKGAHLILPKVERMLGAHGLTPLSPLFDESLIDLSMQLPNHLLLHQGSDKVILKSAFTGRLPESVLHRPKVGMRVPVHFWFQGELKKYARSRLSTKRIRKRGLFSPERVTQLLRYQTDEGPGRYGMRLWMLLVLDLWLDQVL